MPGRLVASVCVLSLLVCFASGALWLRGYTNRFWVQTSPPGTVYAFKIWDGEATLYKIGPTPPGRRAVMLQFPLAPVFATSVVAAILCLAWIARPRKPLAGHCPTCGYDLRASADRCPECGTPIVSTVAAIGPVEGNQT